MKNQTNGVRSGSAAFEPRARLLKLIGSELISDEVVAITELVKNAYDADASVVSIQFEGVTGDDGEVLVRDDGHGMELDTLLTRWMQPAASGKGGKRERYTPAGRRMLGEKGVGRFAADKLSSRLELVSRRSGDKSEVYAEFDWEAFEQDDRMLADVKCRWEVRPADWLDTNGTMLRLTGMRTRWNERMFQRLSSRLMRLVSPFDGAAGFRIRLESDEFPRHSRDLTGGFIDQAPHRIEVSFDGEETLLVRLNGGRQSRQAWPGPAPLRCGPVRMKLFAFDLETEALARIGPRMDVRAWLRDWSGVSVYRDGFRVWPYGEPHDDWLRLDQRRVNNPVVCLSNNQVVGFVEIDADANPELRDQTNREGLIHNEAFHDLQRLALHVFQILEAERQKFRRPDRELPDGAVQHGDGSLSVVEALEAMAASADRTTRNQLLRLAKQVRGEFEAERTEHRKQVAGYARMAASSKATEVVIRSVSSQLEALNTHSELNGAARPLKELSSQLKMLLSAFDVAKPGNERRRALDVPAELSALKKLLEPVLLETGTEFSIHSSTGPVLRTEMRPEYFRSLFSLLAENSLQWANGKKPAIRVTVSGTDGSVEILFSDNGRGVDSAVEDTLFVAGVSAERKREGMGLAVAREIVTSHGGSIELVRDRRRRGTTFRIALPRKKARATRGQQ